MQHLQQIEPSEVVLCSVVKAELYYGVQRSQHLMQTWTKLQQFLTLFVSLPFDDVAAEHYAKVRAHLALQGTPIGPNDLFIAAIALAHDTVLVTHNTREFARVQGLRLENWQSSP